MIPKPIVQVVEAARALVRARRELQRAQRAGDITSDGIEKRRAVIKRRMKALDEAVENLERLLAEAQKRRARGAASSTWLGIFQHLGGFFDLVQKAKNNDPSVIRDAASFVGRTAGPRPDADDIIEGEILG